MRIVRMFAALLLAALLTAGPSARAEDGMRAPAGYIIGVESSAPDPDAAAHVLREGQEVPVQIGGALFDGDQVVVRDASTIVVVETRTDGHIRVDTAHSPHPVKGELPAGGGLSAFAAMIGELFQSRPEATTVNLIGRTDLSLRLQIGRAVVQRVVPGTPLWIGWRGGVGPYRVEIREPDIGGPALLAAVAKDRDTTLILPPGASGPLNLSVTDAQGASADIRLLAGPTKPDIPGWIGEAAPTPAFGKLASALWLLEHDPAEWDLYAASLAAQAGDYRAAQELLRLLADGKRPVP